MSNNIEERKTQAVESLQEAYRILGKTPSYLTYKKLMLKPSPRAIVCCFKFWNQAIREAGLVPHICSWSRALIAAGLSVKRSKKEWIYPLNILPKWAATYIAASIDGEGYIHVPEERSSLYINITNTNVRWLVHIQKLCGGGKIDWNKDKKGQERGYKKKGSLRFRVNESLHLLEQIIPYLIIKRGIAQEALTIYKERRLLG